MPERPYGEFSPPESRPKPEGERSPEAEPVRRTFEYRDAAGKVLGTAEVSLGAEALPMPYKAMKDGTEAMGRKVLSFVLRGEKDGSPTEVDMLALAAPDGVEVLSSEVPLANYHYEHHTGRAVVPPLETPLDVGVYFHELGHAEQHREARFEKITPLYGSAKPIAAGERPMIALNSFLELIDAVTDAVPDARAVFDAEAREQLGRLRERRQTAFDRKSAAERALDEQEMLRNQELRELLTDGIAARIDLGGIADRARKAAMSESHPVPPLQPSEAVRKVRAELEAAGFRFEESKDVTAQLAVEMKRGEGFDADASKEKNPVRRRDVTTGEQVAALVDAITRARAAEVDLRYDRAAQKAFVGMTVDLPHVGKRRMHVELALPEDAYDRYAKLRRGADAIVHDLEERCDTAYEELTSSDQAVKHLLDAVNLRDVAALPTRMMERDATRRALRWLRKIRDEAGVNLLVPHLVQPERLVGGRPAAAERDCVSSTADSMEAGNVGDVETTVVEDLRKALESYGAARMRLRPPGDDEHLGITPAAGRERPSSEPT